MVATKFLISLAFIASFLVTHTFSQGGIIPLDPYPIPTVPPVVTIPTTPNGNIIIINPVVTTTPCQCTAPGNCADGSNLSPRIVTNQNPVVCAAGQVYCCNLISLNPSTTTTVAPATCGIRTIIPTTYVPAEGQASFGEYPWTTLIYRTSDGALIGTGALIDANTVLTAAHKVAPGTQGLRARLGEYIMNAATEPNAHVEIDVSVTRIHPSFGATNLLNNIAILKLASAVDFSRNPHIRAICLPGAGSVFAGNRCWVAGFGTTSFTNNQYQTIMRKVDLPILDGATCQARFAGSRLGASFVFNQQSFICAGGEAGRDACTGDGGAALACLAGSQWVLAGLVAWGVDCGQNNIPGAYVKIPTFMDWIQANRG